MSDTTFETEFMEKEFYLPAENLRRGDRVLIEIDGETLWRTVIEHLSLYEDIDGKRWLRLLKTEQEWDWKEYDTYGKQPDPDGWETGREYYYPDDCVRYVELAPETLIRTACDGRVVLDPMTLMPVRWWVAVYEIDQGYGGPEEGGWYFDTGSLHYKVPCASREQAEAVTDRLRAVVENRPGATVGSVLYSGGCYNVHWDHNEPVDEYPAVRPHYC